MSGTLDANELLEVLKEMGIDATLKEARGVIERFDEDGNGSLDYDEFLNHTMNLTDGTSKSKVSNDHDKDKFSDAESIGYLRGAPHGFDNSVGYDPISFEWRMDEPSDYRQHVERLEARNRAYPPKITPEQIEAVIKDKIVHKVGSLSNASASRYLSNYGKTNLDYNI